MAARVARRDARDWVAELEGVAERLAGFFARSEPRQRAIGYVLGRLGSAERKRGWQLAEDVGDSTARQERERFFGLSLDLLCTVGFEGHFKQLNRPG
jgi:hypothetical protein